MKSPDISTAQNPDLRASMAALQRAAASARKTAIQTDTGIVIVRDGQIVHVSAQELRQDADSTEKHPD
jgi:imidazolonepropionase-like amidohydrolase